MQIDSQIEAGSTQSVDSTATMAGDNKRLVRISSSLTESQVEHFWLFPLDDIKHAHIVRYTIIHAYFYILAMSATQPNLFILTFSMNTLAFFKPSG